MMRWLACFWDENWQVCGGVEFAPELACLVWGTSGQSRCVCDSPKCNKKWTNTILCGTRISKMVEDVFSREQCNGREESLRSMKADRRDMPLFFGTEFVSLFFSMVLFSFLLLYFHTWNTCYYLFWFNRFFDGKKMMIWFNFKKKYNIKQIWNEKNLMKRKYILKEAKAVMSFL